MFATIRSLVGRSAKAPGLWPWLIERKKRGHPGILFRFVGSRRPRIRHAFTSVCFVAKPNLFGRTCHSGVLTRAVRLVLCTGVSASLEADRAHNRFPIGPRCECRTFVTANGLIGRALDIPDEAQRRPDPKSRSSAADGFAGCARDAILPCHEPDVDLMVLADTGSRRTNTEHSKSLRTDER